MMPSSADDAIVGSGRFYTTFGRTALYGALRACLAGLLDSEVIVPAFTCTAVIDAVVQAGARPVFADVSLDSFNLNLADLESRITAKTRVVVSHHYYGYMTTNLGEVSEICSRHGLIHVEDCAHSLGARLTGRLAGSWGDIAVYSFSKPMINAGGGCIATGDADLLHQLQNLFETTHLAGEIFKNMQAFRHLLDVHRDIKGGVHPLATVVWASQPFLSAFRRVLNYDWERISGRFYKIGSNSSPSVVDIDIAMTALQRRYIDSSLLKLGRIIEDRKALYSELRAIVPNAISPEGVEPIYAYFLLQVKDKAKTMNAARQSGIKLRETWPAFQECWPGQSTKNVRSLANEFLMFHLDEFLDQKGYSKIAEFLKQNRN